MAAGDVKMVYRASANMAVDGGLDALASSATWVAGWESVIIDNTTNLDEDILVSGKITVGNAGVTAGQIRVYVVAMLDDSTWPGPFDGTASAETIIALVGAGHMKLGAVISPDTTVDQVYYFGPFSIANLFGGLMPAKCCLFIAHNTTDALAGAGGNQVTTKGIYKNIAAS